MGEQVVAVGVEQPSFEFVVQVLEQDVISVLDEAKVDVVGCLDAIAICNRKVVDGALIC